MKMLEWRKNQGGCPQQALAANEERKREGSAHYRKHIALGHGWGEDTTVAGYSVICVCGVEELGYLNIFE
jgi:hypothetical protein